MQPRISSGPVEPIMKVSLLVNLIERPQLRGRDKCGRIDERSREVGREIVIAAAERIQIVKTHAPRQALNTFGQPSSIIFSCSVCLIQQRRAFSLADAYSISPDSFKNEFRRATSAP